MKKQNKKKQHPVNLKGTTAKLKLWFDSHFKLNKRDLYYIKVSCHNKTLDIYNGACAITKGNKYKVNNNHKSHSQHTWPVICSI